MILGLLSFFKNLHGPEGQKHHLKVKIFNNMCNNKTELINSRLVLTHVLNLF